MVLAGLLAAVATGLAGYWVEAPAVGWGCAAACYIVWVWLVVGRLGPPKRGLTPRPRTPPAVPPTC